MDPFEGDLLPFGEAFGGVDAEYVSACFEEQRYAFFIVSGVDTSAYYETFLGIEHFIRVFLMGIIVLAEYEAIQTAVLVEYRQGVDLVVPNDVVCFGKGDAVFSFDELVNRGHEVLDLFRSVHAADSVVTAGYDADHLAGRGAVFGDGDGGMTCLCLEGEDVSKSVFRRKVGVARNKSCFLSFNSGNHGCFIFRGLGSIDERNAAVSCEFNGHFFTRY